MKTRYCFLHSRRGSVLVGTVAFAALMSISGAAFIRMVGSTINNEHIALTDTKAFHAAESGLWMGTRWLRDTSNFADMESYADGTYPLFNPTIDSIAISVQVVKSGSNYRIESTADIDGEVGYDKTLSWVLRETIPGGFGTFIYDFSSTNTQGIKSTTMFGPFHCNTAIWIAEGKGKGVDVKFEGPATVHNRTDTGLTAQFDFVPKYDFSSGDWGNYGTSEGTGNDYDFGVAYKNPKGVEDLDSLFGSTYTHSAPELRVTFNPTSVTNKILISAAATTDDLHTPGNRATIQFRVNPTTGDGEYHYYPKGATTPSEVGIITGPLVLHAVNQHVNVVGTVKGQVTVWTDKTYSIFPVGDLVYHGTTAFSSTDENWGIPLNNPNMCALYSGENIAFGKYTYDPTSGATTAITDQTVTAQLFALEPGCSHVWEKKNTGDFDLAHYDNDYNLRVVGSRTVDSYLYIKEQGVPSAREINFHYDIRLSHMQGPGVSGLRTVTSAGSSLVTFATRDWTLRNTIP